MINNRDYKWYVISDRGIESGWEYKEDAQDFKRDEGGVVYSKRTLVSKGLDPDDDNSWSKGPARSRTTSPSLEGMSGKQILSAAHAHKWSPERDVAQAHLTKKSKKLHVAETILEQLGGQGKLQVMIGAKQFVGDENMVQFKWSAKAKRGINTVVVSLEPSDTYRVEFYKIRGADSQLVDSSSGVYAEDLARLFEDKTGLYVRL